MASIRKRGPSQWEARIRKRGYPITSRTFETKARAEEWAREIESEMDRGIFVSRRESETTTLAEALERFIEERAAGYADPYRVENRARKMQSRPIADRFLASIRGKDIADFMREREAEGVKPNTIRLDLALLSKLFEICRKDWGMENLMNPVKNVNKPKIGPGRNRRLRHGEEEKLIEAADQNFRPVILFALETAMRREEIATLTWDNVNLRARSAYLPRTKNGEERTVPLSPNALDILDSLPRNIGGSVFGFRKDEITEHMIRTVKRAGLQDLRFHDLRHEATSRFFEHTDLDVMEIRAITGHKTLQMLARYTHLRTNRLADRLAGMGRTSLTS